MTLQLPTISIPTRYEAPLLHLEVIPSRTNRNMQCAPKEMGRGGQLSKVKALLLLGEKIEVPSI